MQPIHVSKNLSAASSNGVGSISTAATSVVTLNTSSLGTGRRLVFYSTADASSLRLTFTGYTEGSTALATLVEVVQGSTGNGIAATTTADFIAVASVSFSSNANIPILIGTSSVGGTTWQVANYWVNRMDIGGTLHLVDSNNITSTATGMTARFDVTLDDTMQSPPNPFHGVPHVFNSTSPVGTFTSDTVWGSLAVDGNVTVPIAGWRLTITSSSSSAGTVHATVLQSG
jgi:hypothetical protein